MRPELILNQRPELRLQLSPQLIQRIEILQLGAADLQELIETELLSNEVLKAETSPSTGQDLGASEKRDEQAEQVAAENGPADSESRVDLEDVVQSEFVPTRIRTASHDDRDPKQEALNNTPSQPGGLVEHLELQLALERFPERLRELCAYLIRCLDVNGWLIDPMEELLIPFDDAYTLEDLEEAVHVIQRLDPPGVGARTPQECLMLQLSPQHPQATRLRKLIIHSLDDLARNRLPKVARDLGETVEDVKALAGVLRRDFDPFPGRRFEHTPQRRVRPDVVVEKRDGRYEIRLEDDYMPRLSVDKRRVSDLRQKGVDSELRKQVRRDVESAKWLIESIEQRKRTLERVAQEIILRQKDFLDHGVNHLKPLKMQEIADELGIHVSTVSRALKGKYIQTPQGVHEMKFFFTGASRGTDGVVESRTGVKERVREIIEKEDKKHPLSDEEIVEKLGAMGLRIARRTVTKYRKSMDIPSSRQRREY